MHTYSTADRYSDINMLAEWAVWGHLADKKDLETVLLKGHLLLEPVLNTALSRGGITDCINFSFYRKVSLLKTINSNDRKKQEAISILLEELNLLRNKLAHEALFDVNDNDELKSWSEKVLSQFEGEKFSKYTYRTRIIHSFSTIAKSILEIPTNED